MKTHKLKEEILFWLTVEASFHSQLAPMQLSMAEKHGRRKGTQVVAAAKQERHVKGGTGKGHRPFQAMPAMTFFLLPGRTITFSYKHISG